MPRRATPRPDPLEETADRLHSAAIHLLRRVRREDEAAGLGPARLSALSVVVFGGPIRISALARAEQVRTPTMTPIVAALERDGLITREPDAADARAAVLRATPKGRRLLAEGRSRRVRRLAADLRPLSAGERRTVRAAADLLLRLFRPGVGFARRVGAGVGAGAGAGASAGAGAGAGAVPVHGARVR